MLKNAARSSTLLDIGPIVLWMFIWPFMVGEKNACPPDVILWEVDFSTVIPQNYAGILKLPPISPPSPIGELLEAIKAAYPPERPPGVLFLSHGF